MEAQVRLRLLDMTQSLYNSDSRTRCESGARMPLAPYKPKKWRLAEKADPLDYQEQNPDIDTA